MTIRDFELYLKQIKKKEGRIILLEMWFSLPRMHEVLCSVSGSGVIGLGFQLLGGRSRKIRKSRSSLAT